MVRQFYRSLDRPMDLFGLKGRWIRTFFLMLGVSCVPGAFLAVSYGISAFIACLFGLGGIAFFGCLMLQGKTPERRLDKTVLSKRMCVTVRRRENASRILLEDPAYISKNGKE